MVWLLFSKGFLIAVKRPFSGKKAQRRHFVVVQQRDISATDCNGGSRNQD